MRKSFLYIFAFLLFSYLPNKAMASFKEDVQQANLALKLIKTESAFVYWLAWQKVKVDELKTIYADLNKVNQGKKLPKYEIVKNNLHIGKTKSGIKIINLQPTKIEYRGSMWSYDRNISASKNYFALKDFLNKKAQASLIQFLMPEASAIDEVGGTITTGDMLIGVFAVATGLELAALAYVVADNLPREAIKPIEFEDENFDLYRTFLDNFFELECNANESTVHFDDRDSHLKYSRVTKSFSFTYKNKSYQNLKLTETQAKALLFLKECKSTEDEMLYRMRLRQSISVASEAMATNKPLDPNSPAYRKDVQ